MFQNGWISQTEEKVLMKIKWNNYVGLKKPLMSL